VFPYRDGELHAENVPVSRIAEAVGTPVYLYSADILESRYREFVGAFGGYPPLVCYAVKANSNLAVLRIFAGLGAGADVVSEGELRRALAAGIPPQRIIFSGVGKTRAELAAALDADIHQINVESVPELRQLSALAAARGQTARIAIRVNPDVDALTHAKISTGKKENKFGIDIDEAVGAYALAGDLPGIEPVGLAMHIGSQTGGLAPFAEAFARLAALVVELRGAGRRVRRVDLGGGLGIRYRDETPPATQEYARLVERHFGPLDLDIACEPGHGKTCAAQFEDKLGDAAKRPAVWRQIEELRADMHRDADRLDAGQCGGEAVGLNRILDIDTELVLFLTGRNLRVGQRIDIGIDPDRDSGGLMAGFRDRTQPAQFRDRLDIDLPDAGGERGVQLVTRLAEAGKDDPRWRDAGGEGATQFAL
jgi:diaminopimelate decarboxylase